PDGDEPAAWHPALAQTGVKICVWIWVKVSGATPGSAGAGSAGLFTVPQPATQNPARTRSDALRTGREGIDVLDRRRRTVERIEVGHRLPRLGVGDDDG